MKSDTSIPPQYSCRFHPTDWWHSVGCPHQDWTLEQLKSALETTRMVYIDPDTLPDLDRKCATIDDLERQIAAKEKQHLSKSNPLTEESHE